MRTDKNAAAGTVRKFLSAFGLAIMLTITLTAGSCGIIKKQYNSNGLSNILVIAIDEAQPKTYIAKLGDRAV